jgi:nitronate monooxygenase
VCAKYKVPIVITSLGAREDVNQAVHAWGGIVLHDIINNKFAHKAIEKGADGLIAVAAGAGGHAGTKSPFALVQEIRQWFDGPLALSGSIANGRRHPGGAGHGGRLCLHRLGLHRHARGARAGRLQAGHRGQQFGRHRLQQPVHRRARQLPGAVYPRCGLDPDNLPESDPSKMNFGGDAKKAWKDIWGCGQGIGAINAVTSTAELVGKLRREYEPGQAHWHAGREQDRHHF